MSEYYHHFLTSMAGMGPPNQSPQDATPPGQMPSHVPMTMTPMSNPYQSLGYFTGFPEPIMLNTPKSQRSRRKSQPGLEHIKHRRTRSGCYTCRSRRVKCDETRPVCDRCRKGKRDCVYPDPPAPKQSGSRSAEDAPTPASSQGDDDEELEHDSRLDTILDEDEPEEDQAPPPRRGRSVRMTRRPSTASSLHRIATGSRQGSETPSLEGRSSSPSTSTGTGISLTSAPQISEQSVFGGGTGADWNHLPHDLRFYLNYYCENITSYHYCTISDPDDFFRTVLPGVASRDEALLYAIVGFAAYHHTVREPQGKMQHFLQYYNKSVTLLLGFLKRKERYTEATLLTILQLATIEQYLGDWVNLMGHQKAAMEVLMQLYTPHSVMETVTGRMAFSWYTRFDLVVSLMAASETSLPQEWFEKPIEYSKAQLNFEPTSVRWKTDECSSRLRLISRKLSVLQAKRAGGDTDSGVLASQSETLSQELEELKADMDEALTDEAFTVQDFSYARPIGEKDIVDPYVPGVLYEGPLVATPLLNCEWHSVVIMHSLGMGQQDEKRPELTTHSYAICQIFEAAERWPSSGKGVLIPMQAPLAIAALFLPRDERHLMWVRERFALLETSGYIFPLTMRTRMAEFFGDLSCVRWWLPDDRGFSPILRSVRALADERNRLSVSTQMENLREVRHVFAGLRLGTGGESQPGGESPHGSAASSRAKGKGVR